jgi:nucleotide-binding universal stress UspA family protein
MYRHILIPTDGSELSQKAVEHGIDMGKSTNAKVTVLTVSPPFHALSVEPGTVTYTRAEYETHCAAVAAKYLKSARDAASAAGVRVDTVHVEHSHPYQAIIDVAAQRGCDLIVMASHGRRGISAVVLGSETVKVLTHSSVPMLVVARRRPSQQRQWPHSRAQQFAGGMRPSAGGVIAGARHRTRLVGLSRNVARKLQRLFGTREPLIIRKNSTSGNDMVSAGGSSI